MLQEVRYVGTDLDERIVRCGGRDQRVKRGETVEAYPSEVERMVDQAGVWEPVDPDAEPPTVEELRARASELDIAGRSKMDREQLEVAIATVEAGGGNPIGATGDPEAIAEANRIAQARGDSPVAFGIEPQDDAAESRSSEDHELSDVRPGQDPEPQQVDAETAGTVGGGDEQPPAEVATGRDQLENLDDGELLALARDRIGAERADDLDREGLLEALRAEGDLS